MIERTELVEFLRESRDQYEEMYHDDRATNANEQYAYGRYHAYCDVLAWVISRED